MPADPSSPIPAALTHLTHAGPRQLQDAETPHLLAYLAAVPDPRATRGRRHPLVAILATAAAAVLAGARSIAAVAEWAADAPQPVRAGLGARHHAPGCFAVPAEATIRRTWPAWTQTRWPGAIGTWLADRERRGPAVSRRRAIAVDGKTLRGALRQAATVARCTCWRRWTTPAARCWPNASSAARPRRCPRSSRCWRPWTWPAWWSPPTRRRPTRRRRVPGRHQARVLPVSGQGQPADPAGPLPAPALTPRPRTGPHPRPRPRPHRVAHPQGRQRPPLRVPARRPDPAGHPQNPRP